MSKIHDVLHELDDLQVHEQGIASMSTAIWQAMSHSDIELESYQMATWLLSELLEKQSKAMSELVDAGLEALKETKLNPNSNKETL